MPREKQVELLQTRLSELEKQANDAVIAREVALAEKVKAELAMKAAIGRADDLEFKLLHVPGHTPGSLVFFNDANRFLLAGDTLFQGSIGRTDMEYGDHAGLVAAIRAKMFPLGDDVTFLPGHGPHGTLGEERQSNPFVGTGG